MDVVAEPGQRPGEAGVVDVAAGAAQQVAMKDQDPDPRIFAASPDKVRAVNEKQTYRMRAPASGREAVVEAEEGGVYIDRETGEELQPVTRTLPLAPSASSLLRSPENLRECRRCEQLIGLDVSDCPYCGLRQEATDGDS
jgi:hypothetical protein